MKLICQYCGGSEGHSEQLHTGDLESEGGWEDWFCCHPCRDAGEPCETFHKIPKIDSPVGAQEYGNGKGKRVIRPRHYRADSIGAHERKAP